jgi:arsenate reductase
MKIQHNTLVHKGIQASVQQFISEFPLIPEERKNTLLSFANYLKEKAIKHEPIKLVFICTHNSRRSHIAQVWAQAASTYYQVKNLTTYSGGTEVTAFNERAVNAMRQAGFKIEKKDDSLNPVYEVFFSDKQEPLKAFSKKYSDPPNPTSDVIAVMTCSQADESCPMVLGASARFALTYDDPKEFDRSALEVEKYNERVKQIGREIFFAFSHINQID